MDKNNKIHKLTAANGRPIADNQNSQTVGPRGPIVLQDPWFLEKLAHFDREVIPEAYACQRLRSLWGIYCNS